MKNTLLLLPTQEAQKTSHQAREKTEEERSSSPFCRSDPSSIPLSCLLEDLTQFAMSMEDVFDDLERGYGALSGLEYWGPELGNVPEYQVLLQRVTQARQAIPRVRDVLRKEVCGPLSQELRLLASHVGNPSWRIFEEAEPSLAPVSQREEREQH